MKPPIGAQATRIPKASPCVAKYVYTSDTSSAPLVLIISTDQAVMPKSYLTVSFHGKTIMTSRQMARELRGAG